MATQARSRPEVDGVILQAPVSDRQALQMMEGQHELDAMCKLAKVMVEDGRSEEILPRDGQYGTTQFFGPSAVVTARRFLSLASPGPAHVGQDDYFSSDFLDSKLRDTFGQIDPNTRVLIVFGARDEFVPWDLDSVALVQRWCDVMSRAKVVVDPGSGVLQGADHTLSNCPDHVRNEFFERVMRFLNSVTDYRYERARGWRGDARVW